MLSGRRRCLAIAVALSLSIAGCGGGISRAAAPGKRHATSAGTPSTLRMSRVGAALDSGVRAAERLGGTAEAAVWVQGWPQPVHAGDFRRVTRMWSMSKPVTAVATLEAAAKIGRAPSATLVDAMSRALSRSENCRQRRVVLGLQTIAGGVPAAHADIVDVLSRSGARGARVTEDVGPIAAPCRSYLSSTSAGLADPFGPALLLGVSTWTVDDAVAFAHALAAGVFGSAGDRVIGLMRAPKARSAELEVPSDYTARLDWGAGRALRPWRPAYKAGWGGSADGRFLVGQIAVIDVEGTYIALAAMFHPSVQPAIDDPGSTAGPAAIEAIFGSVASILRRAR
jgi:hypothetical protein